MAAKDANLVWMDLEMTGLDPDQDRIIEIATVITDSQLNIIDTKISDSFGLVMAIHQPDSLLDAMDEWNTQTHGGTGLTARVRASTTTEAEAELQTLQFIKQYVAANKSPLCGNSICQDRRFLYRYMPTLSAYLHYRNIDVSTIKELAKRWAPQTLSALNKKGSHKALDDILESIEELKFYRAQVMRI
jgi:oligoribonuclease